MEAIFKGLLTPLRYKICDQNTRFHTHISAYFIDIAALPNSVVGLSCVEKLELCPHVPN